MSSFKKKTYPTTWSKVVDEELYIKEDDLTNHNIINFLRKFMSHLNHKQELRNIPISEVDKLIKEFLDDYR